jgi:hypothetical protein
LFYSEPRKLTEIYILNPLDNLKTDKVTTSSLNGKDAFRQILDHTCTAYAIPSLRWASLIKEYASLCKDIPITQITYPKKWVSLYDIEEVLLGHC